MLNIVPSSGWRTAASNYHAVHLPVPPTDEERKAFSAPSLFALKHVAWAIRAVAFGLLLGMALPGLTADYADDFDDGAPEGWTAVIGTWTVDPDNAHSTANGPADIAVYSGESWATGFTYHLKVNNGLTSTSNLAGPVYNYQDTSNYYSVTFAPTGTAYLNKVINGTTTTVATASYSGGGPNVWFDVDVIRSGTSTTVKVNGVTIFSNIVQSELGAGKIGLITTWTDGRFDNVSLGVTIDTEAPSVPTGLTGTAVSPTQINLTWNASTDDFGVTGYTVFLNDAVLGTTTTATSFQHTGLTAGTTYNYRVSAHDAVPNHSAWTATPVSVTTTSSPSTPHTTAIAIPGTWEAENFDLGGEGVAYHDNVPGNAGGLYRSGEDVDIFVSNDPSGGAYIVKNFATGEWLNYTISVPANGNYDIELRVATDAGFPNRAYRLYVDGADVTGPVVLPDTGGWASYQWAGKKTVALTAGTHVLKITSEQQYFDMNQIRMTATETVPGSGEVTWSCSFETSWIDCGFGEHSKNSLLRASIIVPGRSPGFNAVRLHTESGDNDVNDSGTHERNDLRLGNVQSDGDDGKEHWWAHSVLFPNDYVDPPTSNGTWHWGVVMNFHNTADLGGQANAQLMAMPVTAISPDRPTGLHFQISAGNPSSPTVRHFPIGPIARNVWYDFVYHVRWTAGQDGFFHAWMNGNRVVTYEGPTLYTNEGVYLKLANYHTAHGEPSSVIHSRPIRGTTASSVSLGPLDP
jgi:hypothetical protein